ncbi:MAG: M23 family metallopeptidase [Clostridia bacterium]|nr:M23 family metallopeptidase [Clostridia bacterium]
MKNTEATRNTDSAKSTSRFAGLQLVAVQSSVTIIILVAVFMLKILNVDLFSRWMSRFQELMIIHSTDMTAAANSNSILYTHNAYIAQNSSKRTNLMTALSVSPPLTGGVITSLYGEREDPFDESVISYHQGVDIAAASGTPLKAFMSGTVIEVGYEEHGYGHYIVVECTESQRYLYAHCSSVLYSVGDRVKTGELIATVGSSGRATGNHLHFEWIENGHPVDPLSVIPETTYV